jgi:uncharacterized protein with HEPN domain
MRLRKETLQQIKKAFNFATVIQQLFHNIDKAADIKTPLQNAIMFCLKAIGTCIDKAAWHERVDLSLDLKPNQKLPKDTLIFWKNMHYLRNTLVHHFDRNMTQNNFALTAEQLQILFVICQRINQVTGYLQQIYQDEETSTLCYNCNAGQTFRVFLDFFDLNRSLRDYNPRVVRTQIPSQQYCQAMMDAVCIIDTHIIKNRTPLNLQLVKQLREHEIVNYCALQNLLECVATIGDPNPMGSTQCISDQQRAVIFNIDAEADKWLRNLGGDRIQALHTSSTVYIPDEKIVKDLKNIQRLKEVLRPAGFQDKFMPCVPSGTPPAQQEGDHRLVP